MKYWMKVLLNWSHAIVAFVPVMVLTAGNAHAQVNVITVDCTPFVSPNFTSFGPDNTMGMSLQQVDQGGQFNVNEVTPATFRAMTAEQLAMYDLVAINNNPSRIDCGSGLGLGTTWHSVIGINSGGRVVLNSHDAARFKIIIPPGGALGGAAPGPGVEPYGADELVRNAALWAGTGNGTGLLIFNDSARFFTVGGQGWNNPELNLPLAWGITDLDQTGGTFTDGGYTDILPEFSTHPIYANVSDARFGVNSISSFAANISDTSFHSVIGSYNTNIFTPTEVVVNAGIIDVGGFNIGAFVSPAGPNGSVISLIRDEDTPPEVACVEGPNPSAKNVPKAGQKSTGQNEDGFYTLLAIDDSDPTPLIFVTDTNGAGPFGPFIAGDTVKITQVPGGKTRSKSMAGNVVAHIKLNTDAIVTATDSAGNSASTSCLVPPPPK